MINIIFGNNEDTITRDEITFYIVPIACVILRTKL